MLGNRVLSAARGLAARFAGGEPRTEGGPQGDGAESAEVARPFAPTVGSAERRAFVMHENLLRDVITRQAGSIAKAVLEGTMNLIEAGATRGDIVLERGRVSIKDDGRGFASREEIMEAFEVFGKSHERRAKAGRWAEFQMGRGQLMAFGRTSYRTRTFEMVVDLGASGGGAAEYELRDGLEDVPGCVVTVDLYRPMTDWEIERAANETKRAIRYVDVPVFLNGTLASVDPAGEKWTFEDENAYYRVSAVKSDLEVYNLGVFVNGFNGWGAGGTIVTKKRISLNFARNDVMGECPVWTAVIGEFRARTGDALLAKKAPGAKDVRLILAGVEEGRFPMERVMHCALLRDANGRRLSAYDLVSRVLGRAWNEEHRIEAFTLDGARSEKADYAMASRRWLVLDAEFTAEAFEAEADAHDFEELRDLADLLERTVALSARSEIAGSERVAGAFFERETLYAGLDFATFVLADEKLARDEKAVVVALRTVNRQIARLCGERQRRLLVGVSDGAYAWTDGECIVIDRGYLRRSMTREYGLLSVLHTLLHEYTHERGAEDGIHDGDFYRRFHDAAMRIAPLHARVLSQVSRVAGSRLISFQKPARLAVEIRRRLARDQANASDRRAVPCPVCAVFGGRAWTEDPQTHEFRQVEGASGTSLGALRAALASEESFEAAFGARLAKPKTRRSRSGSVFVICPVCEDGIFSEASYAAVTREAVRRACAFALLCAADTTATL